MGRIWGIEKEIGELTIEEELVVANETLLFTCQDSSKNRYLFMTYDSYEGEYVYIPIAKQKLLEMLEGKMPIREVYKCSRYVYLTKYVGEQYESEKHVGNEFDDDMLPDGDLYYTIKSPYILRYIEKLRGDSFVDENYISNIRCVPHSASIPKTEYDLKPVTLDFKCDSNQGKIIKEIFAA